MGYQLSHLKDAIPWDVMVGDSVLSLINNKGSERAFNWFEKMHSQAAK